MKKLKYTTTYISKQVQEKIEELGGIEKYSSNNNISQNTLKLFYKNLNYFDLQLYKIASKILGISLEEITKIEKINIDNLKSNIKFRESTNINTEYDYESLDDDLNKSIKLFSMIIDSYKLRGDKIWLVYLTLKKKISNMQAA